MPFKYLKPMSCDFPESYGKFSKILDCLRIKAFQLFKKTFYKVKNNSTIHYITWKKLVV